MAPLPQTPLPLRQRLEHWVAATLIARSVEHSDGLIVGQRLRAKLEEEFGSSQAIALSKKITTWLQQVMAGLSNPTG